MSDVPDVSGQEIAIGAWHHVSLEATFCDQKAEPNPLRQRLERFERSEAIERLERLSLRPNDAFYAILVREIKKLCRSDNPAPVLTIDTFSRRRYFFRKGLRVSDSEIVVHNAEIVGAV